jgi:hypothetical protein
MADFTDLFVTPHAVEQFQQRITPMEVAKARQVILEGIRQATNIRVLPDSFTWRVRTRRPFPFEFRAYVVFDEGRGHFVVTTIVRGDSRAVRDSKRKAARPESEDI